MPRKLSRARCPGLIGSKAHMPAYKRPVTVPVRKRSTDWMPHHKHNLHFSLYSVRSKSSQISEKIEEQFQTLTVFRSSIQAEPMEFVLALRDSMVNLHHWASAFAIQALDSSQKAINPMRSQREKSLRRRKKETQRIWTGKEEEEESPVYFRISRRISEKQNQIKDFRRFKSNLRIKPGDNKKTYLFTLKNN